MGKKNTNVLMIETDDQRKFLTYEKNFGQLIEFANTFKAEISTVKVQAGEILDLQPLAQAISDNSHKQEPVVEIIEKIFPVSLIKEKPEKEQIKTLVKKMFMEGNTIYFNNILKQFEDVINYSGLSNLMSKIRKELKQEGHEIEKIGAGRYKLLKTTIEKSD